MFLGLLLQALVPVDGLDRVWCEYGASFSFFSVSGPPFISTPATGDSVSCSLLWDSACAACWAGARSLCVSSRGTVLCVTRAFSCVSSIWQSVSSLFCTVFLINLCCLFSVKNLRITLFEGGGRGAVDILDWDCIQFRKSLGENSQLFKVKSSVCNTPCYSVLCEPGFVFLTVFFLFCQFLYFCS